jgi:subtilisin family serine protease
MAMKRLTTLLTVIAILSMVIPAVAGPDHQRQPNARSYVVIMMDDPAVSYEGDLQGLPATKPAKGKKINPNSAQVKKYVDHLESAHDRALRAVGVNPNSKTHDYTYSLNGFAAFLTADQAEEVAKQAGVALVMPDTFRYKETDNSPDFLGLTDPAGPWAKGFVGEDVVVGIIDTGIWPEHPSFADDGSYAPLPNYAGLPCEFGNTAHNPDDAPFECNDKLLGAHQTLTTYRSLIGADPDEFDSARDDDGHGTHTASTAAGNSGVEASIYGIPRGVVSGIAPRARVIAYKGLGNLGGFTSDLAAAIDQAVADGVDVINYSIGGGAAGPGADEIAFLFAADAGVFVATSAGNSGPGAATLGNPGTMPWLTTVGASTQDRTFQGSASSSDGWEFFGASITGGTAELPLVDAADAGDELCNPGALDPNVVSGNIVLCKRGAIARVFKSLAVFQAGGAGTILYNASDTQSENTDNHWTPTVHINNTDGLVIKDYIATATNPVAQINGGEFTPIPAPWMASFSSRGPNPVAGDIIKPDITAPGVNILAGASPFPDPGFFPGELFQSIGGTSMSSPHIAGAFALLKQAHPDWSPAMAKSALMTTAYQDVMKEDGVTPADPFDFGAGHLNVGGKSNKGSAFEPGLAYDAGFLDYLGFLCNTFPEVFADPDATCGFLESIGIPTDPSDLNYPSIAIADLAGSQTVARTVTSVANESGWRTYDVTVDAPEGYSVSVSPSTIRLKKGQSATYEVTITNVSAPIGEWRFGSLTWNDRTGHYDVRSPIAVKASLFDAPAEIEATGESGSASFDVTFGYTGDYTAAPHGLDPATVTSDTVVQDPDQSFDPNDGFSNLHQFTLSDTAFFRIAMPPEATEADADLDIYVFDPDGNLAASSTSGGTNELIDIPLPADGTWDVYVHGWAAPGGDSDYNMWTWEVPLTPGGGSLSVDAAPASATLGATETIDVSWSGLGTGAIGDWYLGAVSHTGDVGLLGLTLVNVDNR